MLEVFVELADDVIGVGVEVVVEAVDVCGSIEIWVSWIIFHDKMFVLNLRISDDDSFLV